MNVKKKIKLPKRSPTFSRKYSYHFFRSFFSESKNTTENQSAFDVFEEVWPILSEIAIGNDMEDKKPDVPDGADEIEVIIGNKQIRNFGKNPKQKNEKQKSKN